LIDWTFRGSIGNYIDDVNGVSNVAEVYGFGRFFFDNTSNIFLVWIMLNIVGGIIIDTFGSLREEENDKLRDKEDNCFICGNLK
jgi:inositol 1,4,5-triphosphate receptor type 1/inositol 1,4,5-triphosphate receptor type 3